MSDVDRKKLLEEGRKRVKYQKPNFRSSWSELSWQFQKMKSSKKKQAPVGQKTINNNGGFSIEEEPISKPEENNKPTEINVSTL